MVLVVVRIILAFGGRPAHNFRTFERILQMPGPPTPGLNIFFEGSGSTGVVLAGSDEMGIESRIIWDVGRGRYVVENIDFRFEEAPLNLSRLADWGFEEVA